MAAESVVELDHPTIRALFEAPTATRPLWAPQGRRLAYTVAVPDVEANSTSSEIWILDAERLNADKLVGGIPGQRTFGHLVAGRRPPRLYGIRGRDRPHCPDRS